ncbi:hypothetical protein [Streptomyces sp. CT34]|nr:hypothetical protein [Streptomyces sp. CT34]
MHALDRQAEEEEDGGDKGRAPREEVRGARDGTRWATGPGSAHHAPP